MLNEPSKVAARILDTCSELRDLAVAAKLDVLAHLLSMAVLQASKDLVQPDGIDPDR